MPKPGGWHDAMFLQPTSQTKMYGSICFVLFTSDLILIGIWKCQWGPFAQCWLQNKPIVRDMDDTHLSETSLRLVKLVSLL